MTTRIDCDTCVVRGLACHDCVVTVLLGPPPELTFDDDERRALDVLAGGGLVPPLRLVQPVDGPGGRVRLTGRVAREGLDWCDSCDTNRANFRRVVRNTCDNVRETWCPPRCATSLCAQVPVEVDQSGSARVPRRVRSPGGPSAWSGAGEPLSLG